MENYNSLFTIGNLLTSLASLLILLGSIILLTKRRNFATILIFISWLAHTLVYIFGFVFNIIAARSGPEDLVLVNAVMSIFYGFTVLLFGIGVLLFFIQIKKPADKFD